MENHPSVRIFFFESENPTKYYGADCPRAPFSIKRSLGFFQNIPAQQGVCSKLITTCSSVSNLAIFIVVMVDTSLGLFSGEYLVEESV
jgi:hypothetical protein